MTQFASHIIHLLDGKIVEASVYNQVAQENTQSR